MPRNETASPKDWPQDFHLENGNYYCLCSGCGSQFRGHKRRATCRECKLASDARWEAMTPEQQEESKARAARLLAEWMASGDRTEIMRSWGSP
jgi:hypothetical protein